LPKIPISWGKRSGGKRNEVTAIEGRYGDSSGRLPTSTTQQKKVKNMSCGPTRRLRRTPQPKKAKGREGKEKAKASPTANRCRQAGRSPALGPDGEKGDVQ